MKMNKRFAVALCVALAIMSLTGFAIAETAPKEEAFAQWNADAPVLNALIAYVDAVTDPDSRTSSPRRTGSPCSIWTAR